MIVLPELIQGTDEWIRARLGVLTASQVGKLLTPTGKLSAQRDSLACTLAAEAVLGEPVDDFNGTYWTDRGSALEDQAGAYFALQTGLEPKAVGFVYRDDSRTCGCSPDWLVWDCDESKDITQVDPICGVEVKCPKAATHVEYLLDKDAKKYTQQVQFSLWVTGLPKWYFMSYFPGLPPLLKEVLPDPKWQKAFDTHVPTFLAEVEAIKEKLS